MPKATLPLELKRLPDGGADVVSHCRLMKWRPWTLYRAIGASLGATHAPM